MVIPCWSDKSGSVLLNLDEGTLAVPSLTLSLLVDVVRDPSLLRSPELGASSGSRPVGGCEIPTAPRPRYRVRSRAISISRISQYITFRCFSFATKACLASIEDQISNFACAAMSRTIEEISNRTSSSISQPESALPVGIRGLGDQLGDFLSRKSLCSIGSSSLS